MIGCKYGPVDRATIANSLPKTDQSKWNHDEFLNTMENEAKNRAGVSEPRVILRRLVLPSTHASINRNTVWVPEKATAATKGIEDKGKSATVTAATASETKASEKKKKRNAASAIAENDPQPKKKMKTRSQKATA